MLLRAHAKPSTRLAFLNADWRAFQGISAMKESPEEGIFLTDYAALLAISGWQITHLMDCPLSTQRFRPRMVASMQSRRTLGVVRRSLMVARNAP